MNIESQRWRVLPAMGILAGLGGLINTWHWFSSIPVSVCGNPTFPWPIIPGGFIHGALLAIVPTVVAVATAHRRTLYRLLLTPVVGWVAGYASWIPMNRFILEGSWLESLAWPWQSSTWTTIIWVPFAHFGLVSVLYFLAQVWMGAAKSRLPMILLGVAAGVFGSLWWWIDLGPWYFALIHGTVWGALAGAVHFKGNRGDAIKTSG